MKVIDWINEEFESVVVADGFEDALIGVASGCGRGDIAIYDYAACVELLVKRDGMSEDEAVEYIEFNVTGAFVGHDGPLFVQRPPDWYEGADPVDQVEIEETEKEASDAVRPNLSGLPGREAV